MTDMHPNNRGLVPFVKGTHYSLGPMGCALRPPQAGLRRILNHPGRNQAPDTAPFEELRHSGGIMKTFHRENFPPDSEVVPDVRNQSSPYWHIYGGELCLARGTKS